MAGERKHLAHSARIARQGLPPANTFSGMSLVATLPAPNTERDRSLAPDSEQPLPNPDVNGDRLGNQHVPKFHLERMHRGVNLDCSPSVKSPTGISRTTLEIEEHPLAEEVFGTVIAVEQAAACVLHRRPRQRIDEELHGAHPRSLSRVASAPGTVACQHPATSWDRGDGAAPATCRHLASIFLGAARFLLVEPRPTSSRSAARFARSTPSARAAGAFPCPLSLYLVPLPCGGHERTRCAHRASRVTLTENPNVATTDNSPVYALDAIRGEFRPARS